MLEEQRDQIVATQSGIGRIEILGHPELNWAGTAFLVNENSLLTTRTNIRVFAEEEEDRWHFRPGMSAWICYEPRPTAAASARHRITGIMGAHDRYDLAFLEIEPLKAAPDSPLPLVLAHQPPASLEGRLVYLVGYPFHDERRPTSAILNNSCHGGAKHIYPGALRGIFAFQNVQLLQHDCLVHGRMAGGCLLDLETNQVLGIHLASRHLERGTALPGWLLHNDPLCRRAGVSFAEAPSAELESTVAQVQHLAHTPFWTALQAAVNQFYERARRPTDLPASHDDGDPPIR
jgi:hypothetical protein